MVSKFGISFSNAYFQGLFKKGWRWSPHLSLKLVSASGETQLRLTRNCKPQRASNNLRGPWVWHPRHGAMPTTSLTSSQTKRVWVLYVCIYILVLYKQIISYIYIPPWLLPPKSLFSFNKQHPWINSEENRVENRKYLSCHHLANFKPNFRITFDKPLRILLYQAHTPPWKDGWRSPLRWQLVVMAP